MKYLPGEAGNTHNVSGLHRAASVPRSCVSNRISFEETRIGFAISVARGRTRYAGLDEASANHSLCDLRREADYKKVRIASNELFRYREAMYIRP